MTPASVPSPPPSRPVRISWRARLLAIGALVVAAVIVDIVTEVNAIVATARIVWNSLVFAVLWSVRGIQGLVSVVARRRAWRLTSLLTSVGFGYTGRIFLSEERSRRIRSWRDRTRAAATRLRRRWLALPLSRKFLIVGILIAAQLFFIPTAAEYILLFPVGFMIRPIVLGARKLYSWAGDQVFGKMYWKYCGGTHRAVVRRCGRFVPVKAVTGGSRLLRLQYLTAWRLWKYHPSYRDASGELWVSALEPFRLWRRRQLDIYVGRPLLSGPRDAACRATEPEPPHCEAPPATSGDAGEPRRGLDRALDARDAQAPS